MKRFQSRRWAMAWLAAAFLAGGAAAQTPLGTSFTYQGVLKDANGPIDGTVSIQFALFGAPSGGPPIAWTPGLNVDVSDGLLTTPVDFGPNAFDGNARWMEIAVNNVALSPRQPITPAPYALKVPGIDGNSLNAADGNPVDALFVDDLGRVGVGTTAPAMSLDVRAPSLHNRPALGVSFASHFLYLHGAADHSLIWDRDASLRFGTETAPEDGYLEHMRITSDGRLGIGITEPEYPLHCVGSMKTTNGNLHLYHDGGPFLSLKCTSTGGGDYRFISTNATAAGGAGQLWLNSPSGRLVTAVPGGQMALGVAQALVLAPSGDIGIGTNAPQAKLDVIGETRTSVLRITGGSDLAEPFNVNGDIAPQPGMLVSIDSKRTGEMVVSTAAYDRTVAGVISGANSINPGMILTQEGSVADGKHPVALSGRVYVWCDADADGAIQPGDLLTSSSTAGHAMKVTDFGRSPGATIGKAMSSLESGRGLVLVLVNLQ